jgi:hypothetical protein
MAASMSVCLQVFNETDFYRRMLFSLQASKKRRGAPSTHTYVGIVCPRPLKWSTMPEIRPWYMTLPLANTRIRLIVSRSRKLGWWIVSRTVRWCVTAIWESICITCSAEVLSRPEVGSSRNNTDGSWIKSTPIETRRLSPPDTPLTWITKKKCEGKLESLQSRDSFLKIFLKSLWFHRCAWSLPADHWRTMTNSGRREQRAER